MYTLVFKDNIHSFDFLSFLCHFLKMFQKNGNGDKAELFVFIATFIICFFLWDFEEKVMEWKNKNKKKYYEIELILVF